MVTGASALPTSASSTYNCSLPGAPRPLAMSGSPGRLELEPQVVCTRRNGRVRGDKSAVIAPRVVHVVELPLLDVERVATGRRTSAEEHSLGALGRDIEQPLGPVWVRERPRENVAPWAQPQGARSGVPEHGQTPPPSGPRPHGRRRCLSKRFRVGSPSGTRMDSICREVGNTGGSLVRQVGGGRPSLAGWLLVA